MALLTESMNSSFKIGEGIGIQLSFLRPLVKKIAERKTLYVFTESRDNLEIKTLGGETKTIEVKKDDSFFKIGGKNIYSFEAQHLSFTEEEFQNHRSITKEKHPDEFTLQDVSDLTRFYIRSNYDSTNALAQTKALHAYRKSTPFKCSYVICPRNANFNKLVAAIHKHIQQKSVFVHEDDYYVWIDIFSSSLFQDKSESNEDDLKESLFQMTRTFRKFQETLIFFENFRDPAALKRLWCVWELYLASKVSAQTPLSVIFTTKLSISKAVLVDFDNLIQIVLGLDPYALESSNSGASTCIKELFTNLPEGFIKVIDTIKATLCSWLTYLVIREYNNTIGSRIIHVTELYLDVGMFLINIRAARKSAIQCLKRARAILNDEQMESYFEDNEYHAKLLCAAKACLLQDKIHKSKNSSLASRNMGLFQMRFNKYKEALDYDESKVKELLYGSPDNLTISAKRRYASVYQSRNAAAMMPVMRRHDIGQSTAFTLLSSVNALQPIQATADIMQSTKFHTNTRNLGRNKEDIIIDLHVQMYTVQEDYTNATKLMHKIIAKKRNTENELYGGMSQASLNFKYAQQLFFRKKENDNAELELAQQQFAEALNLAERKEISQTRFISEKCAYYLALSMCITTKANVFYVLRNNFFEKPGKKRFAFTEISVDNPFVIGCTRRAAQVFFLLHLYAPPSKKYKPSKGSYEDVAMVICEALFGTERVVKEPKKYDKFVEDLREPLGHVTV